VNRVQTVERWMGASILGLWFAPLGAGVWAAWPILLRSSISNWAEFATIAFAFGTFGGLIQAVLEFRDYTTRVDWGGRYPAPVEFGPSRDATKYEAVPETRHFTFCILLPLLRPLIGTGTGFALASIIQDIGVNPGRVALVGLVGGYFASSLMKSLGKSFGLAGPT